MIQSLSVITSWPIVYNSNMIPDFVDIDLMLQLQICP
jgi:hypothetical protein